jgi:aldehyde:ferredoxin oxidoreductase
MVGVLVICERGSEWLVLKEIKGMGAFRRTGFKEVLTGEVEKETLSPEYLRKWIGGRGFNSEVVYHETTAGLDPFSPDNPLCFGVGPLTGTFALSSGRVTISARSPMTMFGNDPDAHGHGDTNMGGMWGPELKFARYDQIIVKGRAKNPVYIWVNDDDVEIRDASHLWGKDTYETAFAIIEELGDSEIKVACIGPAGEKLVRHACVVNFFPRRTGGRTGMGAVMGSKNLKAIAVRGTKPIEIAEPEKFMEACMKMRDKINADYGETLLKDEGTMLLFDIGNSIGLAGAHKNHTDGYAPNMEEKFGGHVHKKKFLFRKGLVIQSAAAPASMAPDAPLKL